MISSIKHRLKFAGAHFAVSLTVAALIALAVLLGLYPPPYRDLSGGVHLFGILVAVDVALGPLATAVVSKPGKSLREWTLDVGLIVSLQLGALAYGLWTIYQARPVYLSFEIDRYRVVHAVDVEPEMLAGAKAGLTELPKWGPSLIAVRPFETSGEGAAATLAALQGAELSFRPEFWMPYSEAADAVKQASKPMAELMQRQPARLAEVSELLKPHGLTVEQARYLPLHARKAFWTAVIHPESAKPVAYLNIDPYPN